MIPEFPEVISFKTSKEQRKQIEAKIKAEYPTLKNVSELVREALREFLDKDSNQPVAGM